MVVALPWQVYELTNSPTTMGVVGAQMVPIFAFTLVGGVASDRIDRRKVIVAADFVRALAAGVAGVLALTGDLELWHVGVMVVVFGLGQAFAGPAFGSIVPQIVPTELLVQANSALFTIHTIAYRLGGPALGGALIAAVGTGTAFLLDAASFVIGASRSRCSRYARPRACSTTTRRSILADIREGLGYVRSHAWLWGTILWSLIVLSLRDGPVRRAAALPREERPRRRRGRPRARLRGGRSRRPGDRAAALADHDPAAARDVHVRAVRVRRHRPLLLRADERAVAGDGDRASPRRR